MIGDNQIVEYINPCFPDRQMYKCKIDSETYHTDDYGKLVDWIVDKTVNADYYAELKRLDDIACASFMADVKYKD
jgi:hypothetical protein